MNTLFVLATSVTVSIDSFFVGFSVSLEKQDHSLPVTVAAVTYVMCLAASLFGQKLSGMLVDGRYLGATILLMLAVFNLFKRDEQVHSTSFLQNLTTAVGVGTDGAAAALSLAIQCQGDVIFAPLLFATTHFAATLAGQTIAKNSSIQHGNVWTAIFLFVLSSMKFLGL